MAYFRVGTLEGLALLPYLGGLALLLGGWRILEWAWPSIAFLAFMIPLPWRVENALGPPLQSIATTVSTYLLQTLGFMAFAEGNVIQLNEARIGVVEACSGLSMLITFIALSTAAALVVKRPLLDRIVLVASSIPVALLANIIRITVTGILHETVGGHVADTFYHDLAGWLMIPLALILYWFEIWILSRLLIETKHEAAPLLLDLAGSKRPAKAAATRDQGLQAIGSLSMCRASATERVSDLRMQCNSSLLSTSLREVVVIQPLGSSEDSAMNPESQSHGELARPVTGNPAVVISAAPLDVAQALPVSRSATARPASATTLSPMSILRALHRRQMLALGVAILAAGISGPAAWFLVPPRSSRPRPGCKWPPSRRRSCSRRSRPNRMAVKTTSAIRRPR